MRVFGLTLLLIAALLPGGCAHHIASPTSAPSISVRATTAPDNRARLTLDEIQPRPIIAPASQPPGDPPLDAVELYARGMDELYQGQSIQAIGTFENAVKADPRSFAIYDALGRAYLQRAKGYSDPAMAAFEQAAALRPDNLQIQLTLARQYMSSGKDAKALEHLRLALQTSQYQADAPGSAAVELFLGHVLQQAGYEQAALDEYKLVSARLANPTWQLREDPDIGFIVAQPELLWLQIAQLQEKFGQNADALESYQAAAKSDPANFQLQARMVALLVSLGHGDEATHQAAEVVEQFGAGPAQLSLLHDVSQNVGYDRQIAYLQRLHHQNPADRPILFALADVLAEQGRLGAARQMLENAAASAPGDPEIFRSLFYFYLNHDKSLQAAHLLAIHLAAYPDSSRQVDSLLAELIRPMRKHPLSLAEIQKLQVPTLVEPARLYLISQTATADHRDVVAHQSLQRAANTMPPFAPAIRAWVEDQWARTDQSVQQKSAVCDALADSVGKNNAALAIEIRGLSALKQGDATEAVKLLERAVALNGNSPDLRFSYAQALRQAGRMLEFQQTMDAIVALSPQFDQAWHALYEYFISAGKEADALRVLAQWLKADPSSESARLYEAIWQLRHGDREQAQQGLNQLLDDHADDAEIVAAVAGIYAQLAQTDAFVSHLEKLHAQQPTNLTIVGQLVALYNRAGRKAEASSLLDQTRGAVAGDARSLYLLAPLYRDIGQKPIWEDVLQQAISVDAGYVPASNDLGYAWADEGKNLDRAEKMIRAAVAAEPDNQAFLDSLGWVLYKQGKFAQAETYFQQAVNPAQTPQPEVLDHFGDLLYRMGRSSDAQEQWQKSMQQLIDAGAQGEGLRLRLQIERKVSNAAAGQPVNVAPLATDRAK
ncbi:MAG: tetratricopeptide repeat protein [Planctomycetota bacterium]|nr:tetratricopeptide repeat protein [Planctomycetota bacterium]